MEKFEQALGEVKEKIKTLMTKEGITDEELDSLTSLNASVDELGKQHQELAVSHSKMKDKYIDTITNFGTSKKPEDETGGKEPTSLEDIAKKVLSSNKK